MKLENLKPAKGATKNTKRIGRGQGSGKGGTATRGTKGAQARAGYEHKIGFEGGQMPIQRRLPKFGFKNPTRVEYKAVNVAALQALSEKLGKLELDVEDIKAAGLAGKNDLVKILGNGELTAAVKVVVEGQVQFSGSLKPGTHAVAADLTHEGVNSYFVEVTPASQKGETVRWSFTDKLPRAMIAGTPASYYFADEGAVEIKGRINMNLEGTAGAELAVSLTNSAGRTVYSSVSPVTGNDFLFSIPLASLPAEDRCTVRFTLRIKGKTAGEETRSFYVMKAI